MGTGGKSHYEIELPLSNGEVRNGYTYGVPKLTFHPKSDDRHFIPAERSSLQETPENPEPGQVLEGCTCG